MFYVDVILPLPLPQLYTYTVNQFVEAGCRVIVQFGKKKFYSAIVLKCYDADTPKEGLKEVTSILDSSPIVLEAQLEFWQWMAHYYMCHLGEVLKAALPSAFKLESETRVRLLPDAVVEERLTPNETKIFDLLSDGKVYAVSEISKDTGIANPILVLRQLIDKNMVMVDEHLDKNFVPKSETFVRLNSSDEQQLHQVIEQLKRAPKQLQMLHYFLHQAGEIPYSQFSMSARLLLAETGLSASLLKSLEEKGVFVMEKRELSAEVTTESDFARHISLSNAQQQALDEIKTSFVSKNVTLLHGVTSSGKTELYIKLISEQLEAGKQVLYLLPEIALTTQITDRLYAVFGDRLGVYHSRFSDRERAEVWNNLLKNKGCQVVLGVRSAVFLPFTNLGLVIVDEEHESSYKQQDPAPRYHGRNAAIVLASVFQAKTLLGTATPAVETYYNALHGKYGLVVLSERFSGIRLPQIEVVDTKELRRKKIMKSRIFSPPLLEEMKVRLEKGEQVILFRNRRGFAPYLECKSCSWTPKCHHCDVSLTYHKNANILVCHYCGATYRVEKDCPACKLPSGLEVVGFGTERVEEELTEYFPESRIARMDLDTTRSRKSFEKIIGSFSQGETDILIGTQMVSKGLDFDNVSLVGILQSDSLMNQPDFRSHERAFQMLEQVSGRSGRKGKQGYVILQTTNPDNSIIKAVCQHDYIRFYNKEIQEREDFHYPPFYRLFHLILKSRDKKQLEEASLIFASILRQNLGQRVSGPIEPFVSRIQSLYIRRLMVKIENNLSPSQVRNAMNISIAQLKKLPSAKNTIIYVDVDPL